MMAEKVKFLMSNSITLEQGSQILFHSAFRTYKEDLEILAQVIEKNDWHIRTTLGNCMQKMGNALRTIEVVLRQFKYFNQMSSTNTSFNRFYKTKKIKSYNLWI
ncbi:hypothetical protein PGB90_001097 [Kerria lacca]